MTSVSGLTSSATASPPATQDAFSALNSEDFVKIMFTELSNQDPLKPNDSSAMLDQLSSLRSIQSDIDLSSKLEAVVTQNQLATAGALIGRWVSGLTNQNQAVIGEVESVSRTSDGAFLNLSNGFTVPFKNVDTMLAGNPFADQPEV